MSSFGTTSQQEYATTLAGRAGYKSLGDAAAAATGRPYVDPSITPFTKEMASQVITYLERKLHITKSPKPSRQDTAPDSAKPEDKRPNNGFYSPRQLRLMATHKEPVPTDMGVDEKWILARLQRLEAIEAFVSRGLPDQRRAVNGNEQIKVAQLIEYFGSEELVADAFGVSMQTLRAWGPSLPPAHSFKAEVLTNGYVQSPRD